MSVSIDIKEKLRSEGDLPIVDLILKGYAVNDIVEVLGKNRSLVTAIYKYILVNPNNL